MFKKLSQMRILMDHKTMTEGERKLALAVALMNYFVLFMVFLTLYFTATSIFVDHAQIAPKDLLEFCKDLTSTFLWGISAVLGLYSGGSILSYKFGQKGAPAVPPPPPPPKDVDEAKPTPKPNNDPSDLIG